VEKSEPLRRFLTGMSSGRFEPATGDSTICGVFVESDDATGLATRIAPLRIKGRLIQTWPDIEAAPVSLDA